MARGTFANIRLVNKFMKKAGPKTLHFPSGEILTTRDAIGKCISRLAPLVFGLKTKMVSSERASQEEQNDTNLNFIAPSSEEL